MCVYHENRKLEKLEYRKLISKTLLWAATVQSPIRVMIDLRVDHHKLFSEHQFLSFSHEPLLYTLLVQGSDRFKKKIE